MDLQLSIPKPENIDAWLEPDPTNLSAMYAILDDPIDAYYQHELSPRKGVSSSKSTYDRRPGTICCFGISDGCQ